MSAVVTMMWAETKLSAKPVTVASRDVSRCASNNGAIIIFLHGSPGNRNQLLPVAMALNEHGYGVLLVDMPGHGESGGRADWGIRALSD